MMDGTFVEALQDGLARPIAFESTTPRIFAPNGWTEQAPLIPRPEALVVGTLTALVEYVKGGPDALDKIALHVGAPNVVNVVGALEPTARYRRNVYLRAEAPTLSAPVSGFFGAYQDIENFVITLATQFVATPARAELMKVIGTIKESGVKQSVDDGISQAVTASTGVAFVANVPVPNPVTLAPFRTFREVDQPASAFLIRLRAGREGGLPTVALFEADGGAWRLAATANVATYLRAATQGIPVLA